MVHFWNLTPGLFASEAHYSNPLTWETEETQTNPTRAILCLWLVFHSVAKNWLMEGEEPRLDLCEEKLDWTPEAVILQGSHSPIPARGPWGLHQAPLGLRCLSPCPTYTYNMCIYTNMYMCQYCTYIISTFHRDLQSKNDHFHLADEETETPGDDVACPRPPAVN